MDVSGFVYALLEDGRRVGYKDLKKGVRSKCPKCGELMRGYFFMLHEPPNTLTPALIPLSDMGAQVGDKRVRDFFTGDWLAYPIKDLKDVTCRDCMGTYDPSRVVVEGGPKDDD